MNYPNISDDDVRNGIAHITTALVSTVRLATLIVNATNLVEGLMASQIDLTSLKALGTTPALWKDAIIFKTRSLALIDKYGSSRTGSTTDITSWENMMLGIINGLKSGELQLLDSSGNVISTGIYFKSIENNKGNDNPTFGEGEFGEFSEDKNPYDL